MPLPPVSRRALSYLHGELAVVFQLLAEQGSPCPPEHMTGAASRALDVLLVEMTRDTARFLCRQLSRPASKLADLGGRAPHFFNCYN